MTKIRGGSNIQGLGSSDLMSFSLTHEKLMLMIILQSIYTYSFMPIKITMCLYLLQDYNQPMLLVLSFGLSSSEEHSAVTFGRSEPSDPEKMT